MTARILFALFIVSSFWACGSDSVTTSAPPALERGLHEVGNLSKPRYWHAATLLQDGKVLIAGGYAELLPVLDAPPPPNTAIPRPERHVSAELFDPVTGTTTPTGDMTVSRSGDHGIMLADGRVIIIPGSARLPIEMYDPESGRFDFVANVPGDVGIRTATLLPNGEVFLTSTVHAGVFDPDTGTFPAVFAMDQPRFGHTATLLKDGRVLIVGGKTVGRDAGLVGRNLIYDPSSEAFSEAGDLQIDRLNHKAVLLQDGGVLIIGGSDADFRKSVQTLEMYDPETNTFSPVGVSTIEPLAAWLLPSGRVMFIRSINGDIALYNPATHEFSPTGHSIGWRSSPTVTLLADGRVMIAGGSKDTGSGHTFKEEITDQILIFTP
ncbi:MAG: hypothetical protein OYM47_13040 [Gemmatimonadota bacterium]|nr:hypothetical protein [Gemmatimonadota bacterium]